MHPIHQSPAILPRLFAVLLLAAITAAAAIPGDLDGDGISNLLEYAFGLDTTRNSAGLLRKPERVGSNLVLTFAQPAEATGITYGAEWSSTLQPGFWTAIPNTGTAPEHAFSVPTAGKPKLFLRWKITIP